MASQDPPSDTDDVAVLKHMVKDHHEKINLLGLLKTNLLTDLTGLQKTVAGLQERVLELQHIVSSLHASSGTWEWAVLIGDDVVEDVTALLAAFDIQNEDVKVRDKRLLAVYIGVRLELL
ncbi:MAG: hypothetical protein OHK93_008449 [Ramalina farinacea]|uniref:Uncharacterized protein n=1 Tax=Ramalina farinacea TaxID=258253 RepID=A0AA43QMF7_9LECA|nr:hypothetical protein [Ramalina farinacea]